ncbi:MAG: Uncharacterized protein G01um101416_242 [Microgenomates group bacterium Gr01-1014_16]|nr:MAG: Uncharacterized protein G01um101416_242 [Microgenomates group bacterium Gr01-1014_16]
MIAAIAALIFNIQYSRFNQFSIEQISPTPTVTVRKSFVLLDVPFTSQAPFGEWGDPRHQDGCEEASALMLKCSMFNDQCLIKDGIIDKNYAKREIEGIWEWEEENYGSGVDTSAEDTAERIIKNYFKFDGYMVTLLHGYEEIRDELAKGRIVIVPVDGRGLNPNYTAPGPERHMILIRGYNDETGEFITNDPGTRKGEKYRYKYETLFNAIRDYPTGDHEPITERKKVMIALGK